LKCPGVFHALRARKEIEIPALGARGFAVAVALAVLALSASPAQADPVIAAAGDIACSPSDPDFNVGLGSLGRCRQKYTSDLLVNAGLAGVLALGDTQYDSGKLSDFQASHDPSWGRVRSITHPAVGNHEYGTSGASGYFDYFNGAGAASGPAGLRGQGYYSFDIGTWHLIALNTSDMCRFVACGAGSPQEQWLRADLAAHPTACTLAYWHHPRFNSGHDGNALFTQEMWNDLYQAGADILLGGHAHDYERFAPQNAAGNADSVYGIREFVVGTGGAFFTGFSSVKQNSRVRQNSTYGVLKLTLHPSSYDWRFEPEAGKSFTDSGTSSCHGQPGTAGSPGGGPAAGGPVGGNASPHDIGAALAADLRALARRIRKLGIRGLLKKRGVLVRGFDALVPGRVIVRVSGKRVRRSHRITVARRSKSFGQAGKYRFKVKLTRRGKRLLRRSRKAKLSLAMRFTTLSRQTTARKRSVIVRR
jgi:hypothetical protein